jgi:hypothetical protein
MAHVEDIRLRSVAENGNPPRVMRPRHEVSKRKPTQRVVVLLVERQIRPVIGVDEEVRNGLVEGKTPFEESEVGSRDEIEPSRRAVGVQGSVTTAVQPESEIVFAVSGPKHHLVVVSQDRHKAASVGQDDQLIENALAVDATINVIAQRDDRVVRLRIDGLDECGQGGRAAVDVANGYFSSGHGSPLLFFHHNGQMELTILKHAREMTGCIFETRLQKKKTA